MGSLSLLVACALLMVCTAFAMRHYREVSRKLVRLTAESAQANATLVARNEFLSTVSHELRTPLTSIRASLDLVLAGAFDPVPDKSAQVLSIAQRNAQRLGSLIDELLDLQKMEMGKMKFDFCTVFLAGLLSDAIADNRAFAQPLGISLKLLPVAPDLQVHADPMRLEQVIANLLSNAAKFSPRGSEVVLDVTATTRKVRIDVRDRGPGLDPADHNRIFDSFSQLENNCPQASGGTGLGLSISKSIIEAHGGDIGFGPNNGGGTVFFIELERIRPVAPPIIANARLDRFADRDHR